MRKKNFYLSSVW